MEKEKQNRQTKSSKEGYIIVTNYFLKKWVEVLGVGPVILYQELLTYCHIRKVYRLAYHRFPVSTDGYC